MVGIVQGVGFRPFVARLAAELGLKGWVRNTTGSVIIEVEGSAHLIDSFFIRLQAEAPPAATIEHIDWETISTICSESAFVIAHSASTGDFAVGLPPDLAICADCLRELQDPQDRRYRYPFINCTACGPRYSIVDALPYDRPNTTMRSFPLCEACRVEYENPSDRRYHAEPIACPNCGPRVEFLRGEVIANCEEAIQLTVAALCAGRIGAIRGIGGFHLACNARDVEAVERLRLLKARGNQPFALMVRDLSTAREFVGINDQAAGLLCAPAAPIVLLPKQQSEQLIAPGNGFLGVMLPYSPLHRLLLEKLDALVMTSGNRHGEPIITNNEDAREGLSDIADFFLLHNRSICAACDDSVVRLYQGRPLAIRRARGYAPLQLRLPVESRPSMAMGADLKAALALADGHRIYLSPHIGDMENVATLEAFENTLNHLSRLHRVQPEVIVHDAHPGYLSTQWAKQYARARDLEARPVQHHRAHAAAVLAEYGATPEQSIVAAVFDGTGYGDDGAIWGGEFFCGTIGHLERRFHLPYVLMPGGDLSAKRPSLAAFAHLSAAGIDCDFDSIVKQQLDRKLNCHQTSSMGRLFDAAASMLGIRQQIQYEAQAAIEMEALAAEWHADEEYSAAAWNLHDLWQELLADKSSVGARSRRFIGTIARWSCEKAAELASQTTAKLIVLSGGVFQNIILLQQVSSKLESHGLQVLVPRYLPPNDGGLAVGQLYLAAVQTTSVSECL